MSVVTEHKIIVVNMMLILSIPRVRMPLFYSTKHLIFGMEYGCIRIQPLHNDDPGFMCPYWSLAMHDNSYGAVTQLATSFDDKYIFSVGQDGNFFAFTVVDDKRAQQELALSKAKVPSAKVCFPMLLQPGN